MNERGISGSDGSRRARRDASMARKPPSVCESKTKACDEARRRGFGDERSGRSLSEMTKRVKSDETHCRTLSKMPRAAFICPASGTQPFSDAAIYAGLHPADVLVYVKRVQGRANRPYQKVSTVGRINDAPRQGKAKSIKRRFKQK